MSRIESQVNRRDDDFVTRDRYHRELAQALRDTLEQTALGGAQKYRDRHVARGKLLPRERVRTLLDPGSPFLEVRSEERRVGKECGSRWEAARCERRRRWGARR